MYKFKRTTQLLIIGIVYLLLINQAQADWQSDLEIQFDIVETFDQLQDWHGDGANGAYEIERYPDDFPKKLDGSPSMWKWYSYYQDQPVLGEWIGNHGTGNAWQGTKSLRMNISHRDKNGPSRLGTYFGDGTRESGYSSVYVFYMVKIHKNQWPTSIVDGVGEYNEEEPYLYLDSWKFNTMNMGCKVAYCNQDIGVETNRSVYSDFHSIPHVTPSGISGNPQYTPSIVAGFTDYQSAVRNSLRQSSPYPYPNITDWIGVEFHWYFKEENGHHYGVLDVWWYENDGTPHLAINGFQTENTSQPASQLWNSFFFGGNNSYGYSWGESMEPAYFVDDFIIDNQRIGPTYFNMLNNQSQTVRADVDNNSTINTTDAMLTLRNSLGLSMSGTNWYSSSTTGDVNCDGTSNSTDAMLILRYSLGLSMEGTGWCR